MVFNIGSVAEYAWLGLDEVPTSISGNVMQKMAETNIILVNNYLKVNITGTSISDKYFSILVNLTKADTLKRIAQVGANFNWSLGTVSVNKGAGGSVEVEQIKSFYETALAEMKQVGVPLVIRKANG